MKILRKTIGKISGRASDQALTKMMITDAIKYGKTLEEGKKPMGAIIPDIKHLTADTYDRFVIAEMGGFINRWPRSFTAQRELWEVVEKELPKTQTYKAYARQKVGSLPKTFIERLKYIINIPN